MDALEAIFSRRSSRHLKASCPPRDLIEQVIEAGRAAPSGANSRTTHMLVIADPDVLSALAAVVQAAFAEMEADESTYVSLRHSISASKKGGYVFHYNAPVLIVTANKKGYGNALADSACALENMMIAARALGLGSCWINQLHWLDGNQTVRSFMENLGLKQDETITGGLILGYDTGDTPKRHMPADGGNPVTWILGEKEE